MRDLKLYVWEDVLIDHTSGMMVALAHNVEEANRLLLEADPIIPELDLRLQPSVYDTPCAFAVWGGG